MEKKKSGKIAGKIFLALVLSATAFVIALNIYLGGQMKTTNKYVTALIHEDYKTASGCFVPEYGDYDFEALRGGIENICGEDFRIKSEFISRNRKSFGEYGVTAEFTVYNNDSGYSPRVTEIDLDMRLIKGKWLIAAHPDFGAQLAVDQ